MSRLEFNGPADGSEHAKADDAFERAVEEIFAEGGGEKVIGNKIFGEKGLLAAITDKDFAEYERITRTDIFENMMKRLTELRQKKTGGNASMGESDTAKRDERHH